MSAIAFTEAALQNVKRGLRAAFPERKSSHLTEGLAVACGFRTQAALLDALARSNQSDPEIILLDDEAMMRRLYELEGDPIPKEEDFEWFEVIGYPEPKSVIKTRSNAWYELAYTTLRHRAWRNLMVAAINEGISRRLFTLRPGDNRWPGAADRDSRAYPFRFEVSGIPAVASVADIGHDELSIHCAAWPSPNGERAIGAAFAGFAAGDAVATGWLERQDGAWLQFDGSPELHCRAAKLTTVASLAIPAMGFGDRGDRR